MKKWVTLLSLIASVTVHGFEELHKFSLNDGSTFDGIVISCNSQDDTVELLTSDGEAVSSSFSTFSSETQDYLKQWEVCDLFMSPTRFVVIPSHSVDRQWVGKPAGGLNAEGVSLVSNVSKHQYSLSIHNLGSTPLDTVTVDYHITYSETSSPSDTSSIFEVIDGVIPVTRLDSGGRKLFSTPPVTLIDTDTAPASSHIEITLNMELPDGKLLSRQIKLPDYQPDDLF